jgi:hypothetical protein
MNRNSNSPSHSANKNHKEVKSKLKEKNCDPFIKKAAYKLNNKKR